MESKDEISLNLLRYADEQILVLQVHDAVTSLNARFIPELRLLTADIRITLKSQLETPIHELEHSLTRASC